MSNDLEPVILSKYLGFDDYQIETDDKDPGKEDISFLLYVARMVPKRPQDINNVDPKVLASLTLAAHALASERFSKSHLWHSLKKINAESSLGHSINDMEGAASTAEKRAKKEDKYVLSAETMALGEAYVKFYQGMVKNFEAGHYWAKEEEKSHKSQHKMSGYEPLNLVMGGNAGEQPNSNEEKPDTSSDFSIK